jgi:type III secretion system FlhB-like substrate exporter
MGCTDPAVRAKVLDRICDTLLLSNAARQPLKPEEGQTALPLPPPGLSRQLLEVLTLPADGGVQCCPTHEDVVSMKLGLVRLLTAVSLFTDVEVAAPLLVASGDPHRSIADQAETAVRRREIDLDKEPKLLQKLVTLFLGTVIAPQQQPAIPPDARRRPCRPQVRVAILNRMVRATAPVKAVALALPVIFNTLYQHEGHTPLRVLGLQFLHKLLGHASDSAIAQLAPLLLTHMTKMLDDPSTPEQVMGLAYGAVGHLGRRAPDSVKENVALLRKLFQTLNAGGHLSLYVQEALGLMKQAYATASADTHEKLVNLLMDTVVRGDAQARMLAVQYARGVLPPTHVRSRFVCMLAAADERDDTRAEGLAGLHLTPHDPSGDSQDVTAMDITVDAASPRVEAASAADASETQLEVAPPDAGLVCPAFPALVSFLHRQFLGDILTRKRQADRQMVRRPQKEIPYKPNVLAAALAYARASLGVCAGAEADQASFKARYGSTKGRLHRLRVYLSTLSLGDDGKAEGSEEQDILNMYRAIIELCMVKPSPKKWE